MLSAALVLRDWSLARLAKIFSISLVCGGIFFSEGNRTLRRGSVYTGS